VESALLLVVNGNLEARKVLLGRCRVDQAVQVAELGIKSCAGESMRAVVKRQG
jgi:hypothetical protein